MIRQLQYKAFDEWLLNYRHIDSRIARRKFEIETFHVTDVNIGGSRSNKVIKRTEWLVERFDSDTKLCFQRGRRRANKWLK